jgi:parallel beta-helix repeat protein
MWLPKTLSRYLVIAILGLSGVLPARAAVYHIAPGGSDRAAGTKEAPWATLQKAADVMVPGDMVLVADGVYGGFQSVRSGSPRASITFKAAGEHVILDTQNPETPDIINIEGHDCLVIEGFMIQRAPRVGVRVVEASDVVIRGNRITECGLDAILTGYATRVQIIDNVCANSTREHGIYVSNSRGPDDNPVIQGNTCFGNGRSGIQLNGDCYSDGDGTIDNGVIEGNYVFHNKLKGISLISARNFVLRNNVIFDNEGGAAGVHLTDEPDCGNPSMGVVVNNTIVESKIAGIRITDDSVNNRIFNNIIVASEKHLIIADEVGASDVDAESNVLRTSIRGLFKDPDKRNYHLTDNSAARGRGVREYKGIRAPSTDREGRARATSGALNAGAFEDNSSGAVRAGGLQLARAGDPSSDIATDAATVYADPPRPRSSTDIIAGHPRLWLTGDRLETLRRKACLDLNGNPIPGCQRDSDWNRLEGSLPSYWGKEEWHDALAYVITGDVQYANRAISDMDTRVQTITNDEDRGQGNFLRISGTMRSVALVYDWCYDLLSPTQRQIYRDYMNQLLHELWNPFNNPTHEWDGWGVEDPGNNFYYSFMLGTAYAGLAMHGENPSPPSLPFRGTTYNDILEFLYARIEQQSIDEHLNTWGKGGAWHEGNNYGLLSKRYIIEMFTLLRDAGAPDFMNQTDFVREALLYHLYSMSPDFSMGYPGGDLAGGTDPYDIDFMLLATHALEGTVEAEYAQYFANHVQVSEPWSWWEFIQPHGVLFRDPDIPERDWRNELPLHYFAEGGGWMNSRSGWGEDDVSVSFVCTNRIQGHQSQDQAAFLIFKNDFQATHGNLFSNYGIYPLANAFNTLLIDGNTSQAYGVDWDDIPTVVRDIGFVRKFEGNAEFSYVVGDASDAYYTNAGQFGNGNQRLLDIFTRELVHIRPGYVVVYDRVTPRNPDHLPTWQLHTENLPTQSGNRVDASLGTGQLSNWTLLPENHTIDVGPHPGGTIFGEQDNIRSFWTRVDPVTPQANHLLLNVLFVRDASDNVLPAVTRVTSQGDNMVGAKITRQGEDDIVVMFSTDPVVDVPVTNVIYDVGLNVESVHMLFGLAPRMLYDVDVVLVGGGYRVTVAQGKELRSSQNGVLSFDMKDHIEDQVVAGR